MKKSGLQFMRTAAQLKTSWLVAVLALVMAMPLGAQVASPAANSSTPNQEPVQTASAKTPETADAQSATARHAVDRTTAEDSHGHHLHIPLKYDVTKIGQRGIGGGLNLYSIQREEALGKQLAMEVEQQSHLITDPVITEYVNRIGQNIVRNSDAKVPFTIKVIDSDEVNAFALPGGYFYVNSGLILAADNEAELAGVMAHEVAHVAARHATKQATRGEIMNLASIPLIFFGGPAGYAVRQIAGFAVPMGFLKFSRDAEREADLLGLEYQYAAGYDPGEFVHFFETIKAREKEHHNVIAKAFSTHPMTGDRIRRAQDEISDLLPPKDHYVVTTSEFDEVKARLAALENNQKVAAGQVDRPTLHRRSANDDSKDSGKESGRPTLRRRSD